jgi:tRNA pseudouridine55 synthase
MFSLNGRSSGAAASLTGKAFRLFPRHQAAKKAPVTGPLALINGFIAINKPQKFTSNDVVQKVKWNILDAIQPDDKAERRKMFSLFKVGHGGTLDPNATGVLVLGFGEACKQFERYLKGSKEYLSTGRLGISTDTDDIWGRETEQAPWEHVNEDCLREKAKSFTGMIMQRPPNFSAISIDGVRMYDLALKGRTMPEIPSRPVTIYTLEIKRVELPEFEFRMHCSGGTYVRSFVRDLGKELGTVATMTSLVRTVQGDFSLEDCLAIEQTSNLDLVREKLAASSNRFAYGK